MQMTLFYKEKFLKTSSKRCSQRVAEYKINVQKSRKLLYANNELSKEEFKKINQFRIVLTTADLECFAYVYKALMFDIQYCKNKPTKP